MQRDNISNVMKQFEAFALGFEPFFKEVRSNFTNYPPHNVINYSDNRVCLEIAVAGFKRSEISVSEYERTHTLEITGKRAEDTDETDDTRQEYTYSYKGIGARPFTKTFKLADGFKVENAALADGILRITLVKQEPDECAVNEIKIN